MTTIHDKYIKLRNEFNELEKTLYISEKDISCRIHPDGLQIETRTPSGTNDIVHSLYLTKEQALFVRDYVNEIFVDMIKEN